MTRCNCDASCGENRYHNVGDSECRFKSEEHYEAYWEARRQQYKRVAESNEKT